ncbi:MAG: IS110 family transposase [Steroidobacteraceae bacterium]
MSATIAIDLAKNVFELAVADGSGEVLERKRLSRAQFVRFFDNRRVDRVVMEACGTAHYWGRWFAGRGVAVSLLPAQYVRAYVRRNKTDRADAAALLEAAKAPDILPVQVKSVEQQALQSLHRVRQAWMSTRVARINTLRGLCREFGINAPVGAKRGMTELTARITDPASGVPDLIRCALERMIADIHLIEENVVGLERELARCASQSEVGERLRRIPGVGLLTATALLGSVGDIHRFRNSRRFASWLGLTPKEHSSGSTRRLGSISKRGDKYIRMLLVHGARAIVFTANAARRAGRPLDAFRQWAAELRERLGHNKAVVAVANKLARIIWASWSRERDCDFRGAGSAAAA